MAKPSSQEDSKVYMELIQHMIKGAQIPDKAFIQWTVFHADNMKILDKIWEDGYNEGFSDGADIDNKLKNIKI